MSQSHKIRLLDDLSRDLESARAIGKRIVQCHGIFDLLHIGHIRHLEQARENGDLLIVTITPDCFVNKGANRPAFPESLRAEALAALNSVDFVAITRSPSAAEAIEQLRPHVFCRGPGHHDHAENAALAACEDESLVTVGAKLVTTTEIAFSASALINQYLSNFPEEVSEYLQDFLTRYDRWDVFRYLEDAERLKVLVVGETIIDEYHLCEAMGKSGKEPVLATKFTSTERHAGGVLACANHLANFCAEVDVVTMLGADGDEEDFVRASLKANVTPKFFYKSNSPTIVKTRFLERYLSQKLFEVYRMNDEPLNEEEDAELCNYLAEVLPQYDVVIVTDYGHSMLSPQAIEILGRRAKFLAVNTQSNAGNNGFNMISKYPRADYVCLAHREFALETRNQRLTPEEMMSHVAERLDVRNIMLTQGKFGSLNYSHDEGFVRVPAFATRVVDRVGAGDSVLCLTALCVAQGAPAELVGFVGNVVGAEAVMILGNQRSIERGPLLGHIGALMRVHRVDDVVDPPKPTILRAA